MALTLNNFVGFETGGLEELLGIYGTPTASETQAHAGDYACRLADGNRIDWPIITGGSTGGGNDYVVGFWIYLDDITSTLATWFRAYDDSGSVDGACFSLELSATNLVLKDSAGSQVVSVSNPFSTGEWQLVEIRWQYSDSGAFDLHVDGVSKISETGVDLKENPAGTITEDGGLYLLFGRSSGGANYHYADDIYCYSGASGTGDFLGNAEVFRYQADTASATPDTGDDIEYGSSTLYWQEVGTTPGDADEIGYTTYPTTGAVYTDDVASGEHYRHGPHGDANIDGTIKGGKWLHQLRGGGAGDYYKRYGNDGDGLTDAVVTLTTAYVNYMTVSELATVVPLVTEHFAIGIKNLDEKKDLFCKGMWAFILHVPSTGPEEYQKSFGETASMSVAFAKGLTLAATIFAETHSHSESVVKTMYNPFAETASLAETLVRLPGKVFSETASLAEGIARKVGLGISETASLAEAFVKRLFYPFTETANLGETLTRVRTKVFSETAAMSETIVRGISYFITETASLAEGFASAITFRRVLAEAMSVAESLARLPRKVFSETADLSESLIRLLGKVFAETASLGEAVVRKVGVFVAETANLTEALGKSMGEITKVFGETMSLAEGFAVKVGVSLGESMNMAEAIVRGIGQQIAETANLAESFAPAAIFRKVLAETKSLAEALSRKLDLSQVFAEATALAESLVSVPGKAFAEATSLAEALVRKITRTITETASMTESLARGRFKSFAETLSGLVETLGTVFVPGGGPPAVLRKLAYYAISLLPSRTRRRGRK